MCAGTGTNPDPICRDDLSSVLPARVAPDYRFFDVDVLACPECGERLRLIAFIAEGAVARRILDHLGLDSTGPPAAPPRRHPEPVEPAPDYDVADPVFES